MHSLANSNAVEALPGVADQMKAFVVNHTSVTGGITAAIFGAASEAAGLVTGGNTVLITALCGLAGAFIGSLPKIISERSKAKLSESEYVGKEMRGLIDELRKRSSDSERILAIKDEVRHRVLSSYHAEVTYAGYLASLLADAGVTKIPPRPAILDVGALNTAMDQEIKAIKNAPVVETK